MKASANKDRMKTSLIWGLSWIGVCIGLITNADYAAKVAGMDASDIRVIAGVFTAVGVGFLIDAYRVWRKSRVKPKATRRKGWFWTGVGLLIGGGVGLFILVWEVVGGYDVGYIEGMVGPILTGTGIFCVIRSMRPLTYEEKVREAVSGTKPSEKEEVKEQTIPDRNVWVYTTKESEWVDAYGGGGWAEVTYTKIRVEHRGKIPCVMELPLNYTPRVWFWTGIVLLGLGVIFWVPSNSTLEVEVIITAAILTGFGSLFIYFGRRPSKRFEYLHNIKFTISEKKATRKKRWFWGGSGVTHQHPILVVLLCIFINGRGNRRGNHISGCYCYPYRHRYLLPKAWEETSRP